MSAAPPVNLRLEGLCRSVDERPVLDGVELSIHRGELFCLFALSAGGPADLLRVVAGLAPLDAGSIELAGTQITAVPAHLRPVNTLFRSHALFPHLDVTGNIRFGLRREGLGKGALGERIDEVFTLLDLRGLARRRPHQLSALERFRVALARCLAKRPQLLLLEEPLGALPPPLRDGARAQILDLQNKLGITFLVATQDPREAMSMADRMGVMETGRLVQVDSPGAIYDRPANRHVAESMGPSNRFDGVVTGQSEAGYLTVHVDAMGDDLQVTSAGPLAPGRAVAVVVRPQRMQLLTAQDLVDETFVSNAFEAVVAQQLYRGDSSTYLVRLGDRSLRIDLPHGPSAPIQRMPTVGERVRLAFAPDAAWVLPA